MTLTAAKRERYRQESRLEILDAAREIFLRDGFGAFTMRRLAERVGCSPGAIYLHFESKDALFEAGVEESFAQLHDRLRVLLEDRGEAAVAQLKRGLRIYVDWGLENPDAYRIAFIVGRPENRPYATHAAFEVARTLVGRCLPGAVGAERESAAQALWAAAHGVTSLLIQRPTFPWVSRSRIIEDVIDGAVLGAVSAKNGTGGPRGGRHGKRT